MRRIVTTLLFFLSLMLAAGCQNPLVEEGYGTMSEKSINGFDLLREYLKSNYDVQSTPFADRKKLGDYDLVIYLQRDLPTPEHMDLLNAQIAELLRPEGVQPDAPADEASDDTDSDEETESDDAAADDQTESDDQAASDDQAQDSTASETSEADASADKGTGGAVGETVNAVKGGFQDGYKPVSFLVFERGTTSATAFWSRQLHALPKEASKARQFVEGRIAAEALPNDALETSFFFDRIVLGDKAHEKWIHYHPYDRQAYTDSGAASLTQRIPVGVAIQTMRSEDHDSSQDSAVMRRSLISVGGGSYFMAATVPGAHLFLVADSAPFLNYHLVRKDNLALLDFILARSMQYSPPDKEHKPKILILESLLTKQERMQEENRLFAMFFQRPWNLVAGVLVVFFVLYVWSKLLRDRPVTEVEPEGSEGDLLRHFEGVGRRIAAIAYRNRKRTKTSSH